MFSSTLTHEQHKENKMSYEQEQRKRELDTAYAEKLNNIQGLTAKSKRLKRLADIAMQWSNSADSELKYGAKDARRREALIDVRAGLMADESKYFNTLDFKKPMLSYEYESLNARQQAQLATGYPFVQEELINAEIATLINDTWYEPLQELFDSMSEEEQATINGTELLSISFYTELKNKNLQPRFILSDGTVKSGASILNM